jgi:hypothetical protein
MKRSLALGAGCAALLLCAATGWAQTTRLETTDKDWQEADVPAPPAFDQARLVPFVVSANSALRYGIDPTTVSIGSDGVIRYVVVATSTSGALNVLYEGLRCASREAKTYARWNPEHPGHWVVAERPEWRPLAGPAASRIASTLARGGFCEGGMAKGTPESMLRELRYGRPAKDY